MNLISLSIFISCWKDFEQFPQIDINKIPFENTELNHESVYISTLDSNLACPDGKMAPIFVVYPESDTPLPVAVIFHSNPVSFISDFERRNSQLPLRLQSDWAQNKLWETLGLSKNPQDLNEENKGYLPTALSDAGFVQVYPGNCWGDYWHSDPEIYPNAEHIAMSVEEENADETVTEFGEFSRYGRTMAIQTIQAISNPTLAQEIGLNFPQEINSQEQHWIGLGEGGRAILELLALDSTQESLPKSVIFDSSPLDLQPYLEQPSAFPLEIGTLEKVFVGEEGYPLSDLSSFSWDRVSFPDRTAIIWSNGDSQMPQSAFSNAVIGINSTEFWQEDQNQSGHIFLNRDITLARRAAQFMQTGDPTLSIEEPTEEPTEEPGDTGAEDTESEDTGAEDSE